MLKLRCDEVYMLLSKEMESVAACRRNAIFARYLSPNFFHPFSPTIFIFFLLKYPTCYALFKRRSASRRAERRVADSLVITVRDSCGVFAKPRKVS